MRIGRGRPKNAISHRIAPSEKNQNSSAAQKRSVTVARAKAVKNVWLRIAQIGRRKIAKINFTQRVGTVSGSDTGTSVRARATLRTTLRSRLELRFPRLFADLLFLAAKVAADYAELAGQNQDRTADYADTADKSQGRRSACQYRNVTQQRRSRTSHVGTSARVDLDGFAFLDEQWDVDDLAGLQGGRLGNVTRRVAAQALRGFGYLQAHRRG